jgi:pseudouridine synthase
VYVAKTNREVTLEHLKRLSLGTIVEGTKVVPVRVDKIRKNTVKIGVKEGRKREVRQLLEDVGLECISLKRVQIGPLTLGDLPTGVYRALTDKELSLFTEPASKKRASK